jgi:hypothetical protein
MDASILGGPLRRVSWALIEHIGDEWIVLDPMGDRYLRLNRSGAALWERLATSASAGELSEHLQRALGAPAERASADVTAFLAALAGYGLVEAAG